LLDQALDSDGQSTEVALRNRSDELLGILVLQLPEEGERRRTPRQPFKRFVEGCPAPPRWPSKRAS
jgi:hypothetical protein